VTSLAFIALIVNTIFRQPLPAATQSLPTDLTRRLGESVLTRFVLPFELLGVLMLAAMLGAVYFARPED
jgi:NADH:ubiquinone oxidoreductase subunit 6 (subunit J)